MRGEVQEEAPKEGGRETLTFLPTAPLGPCPASDLPFAALTLFTLFGRAPFKPEREARCEERKERAHLNFSPFALPLAKKFFQASRI